MDNLKTDELIQGKIYYVDYGNNTQIVFRYKSMEGYNIDFFDCLHYWNGYERFCKNTYCVTSGIEQLRRATKAEIHTLVRHEIENDCI